MNTARNQPPMYEWKDLPWSQLERGVFKLQKRIYQASQRGDVKTVHRLQKLLMRSWSAQCLATRRVSQDNQGKKTAGVDGVKSLTPPQRLALAQTLTPIPQARPVRRVWIPKPGTQEQRPLGIPTMRNRAAQALVKLALEPEWEAKFEPNSYGFRPGRSCHDAVAAVYLCINRQPKYVLDADLTKCFDRINHTALLAKLATFPTLRRVIKAWLQAGLMERGELFPTEAGTPQGGVISPLLANIALHGLETAIRDAFPQTKTVRVEKYVTHWKPYVIRYADDFVVLHQDITVIQTAQAVAIRWLREMGLELNLNKTRISHTLQEYQGNVGFDFLGHTIRQFPSGKTHTGSTGSPYPKKLTFKTLIRPSRKAQQQHVSALKTEVRRHRAAPQGALIAKLNPLVTGWTRYFSTVAASHTFGKMDTALYQMLRSWAQRRHSKKNHSWVAQRYWRVQEGKWEFCTRDGLKLWRHYETRMVRHIKVQRAKSPYDGAWLYWAVRMGRRPDLPKMIAFLLRQQRGKCAHCGLFFQPEDLLERDHIQPQINGGTQCRSNQQLLHRHCHDQKTAHDGSHPQQRKRKHPIESEVRMTTAL